MPETELIVVYDSVLDIVSNDRLSEHMQVLFILKLRRMAADKCHLRYITKELLESIHLSKHVNAVDAAGGPEVDNYELAF